VLVGRVVGWVSLLSPLLVGRVVVNKGKIIIGIGVYTRILRVENIK
jgi:hypothetical protein